MSFSNEEFNICKTKFTEGNSTKEVQDYLMNKYNCKRSKTSNFIKLVRKCLGIYHSNKKAFDAENRC